MISDTGGYIPTYEACLKLRQSSHPRWDE